MAAQLVALADGRVIPVDKGILVIGRHAECDVQIMSPKVSRMHCCIAQVGEHLIVRDLNSTNGIRVNGVRVVEGRLGAGDELAIGNHRYRVQGDGVAAQRPANAIQAKAPVRKAARPGEPDLEECDEPVALPDPANPRRQPAKNAGPKAGAADADAAAGRTESSGPDQPALALPEVEDPIEVSPASEKPEPPPASAEPMDSVRPED
jgi:predicted component of type VI protein secretion system